MLRIVRLDRHQESASFEDEFLAECLFARLDGGLPDADLIVYRCDTPNLAAPVAEAIGAAKEPVLLHLSNESLQHRHGYYVDARWVFRGYYDPNCTLPNVSTVPLGYRSGFHAAGKALRRDARENVFVWAFAGQKKSDRKVMADNMERLSPHFAHYTSGWLSSDMLTVDQVSEVYAKTQVVPCPMGNINPDSFRVMEALEIGSVPVVVRFFGRDFFKYTFGDHPFIVGADWADCTRKVERLLRDPAAYEAKRKAVERWYARYKDDLAEDVARIIRERSIANCRSSQFDYQRQGKSDLMLRAAFAWHFAEKYRMQHRLNRIGGMLKLRRRGADVA
jgi:hypothetical protein